ncbi:unnamed protein product [Prorocentrum cordatum]|uniref:FAD-binding PCMH-type domain-containing protein n=1 Tax=Prorocentrum cordatum TaxID=2364126 RepID=A0ABN9SUV4_9DINO|nr:unnamed protein product [Polarella glacialis]
MRRFCTPGIVMSLYSMLANKPEPTVADIESAFDGNLCRCTGYRPILDAGKTFACDKHAVPSHGKCGGGAAAGPEGEGGVQVCSSSSATVSSLASCKESLAVPFPDALRASPTADLKVIGKQVTWYRPSSLPTLLALKKQDPTAKLVSGNTEIGIETKFKKLEYPVQISTAAVRELHELCFDAEGALVIGGAVTLSSVEHFIEDALKDRPLAAFSWLKAMLDMLRWFASGQIRNVAALAGNLATASPISDMNPVLMALGATVTVAGCGCPPREVLVREFFKRYRTVDMSPSEVICRVRVPPPTGEFEFARSFKQARRRDDDISIVNACIRVELSPGEGGWTTIRSVDTGFGGMAPTTKRARRTEEALVGAAWGEAAIERACAALAEDLPLPEGVPGGMAAYRQTLAASFLKKFYLGVSQDPLSSPPGWPARSPPGRCPGRRPCRPRTPRAAATSCPRTDRPQTSGEQRFSVPSGGMQHSSAAGGGPRPGCGGQARAGGPAHPPPLGAAAVHRGGEVRGRHAGLPGDTLHAAFVLSERARAKLLSVDASAALALPGVKGFFSAKDIDEHDNVWGPILPDEQLFRRSEVTSTGQIIGVVVAQTQEQADAARRLVKVEYEDLEPVLTIEDAIRAKSFHQWVRRIDDGDVDAAFALPDTVIVEGEFRMGGQEHFYLETNACHVVPGEGDELTIYASTQAAMKTQKVAAHACGIQASKVVCKVKRMGGGFGGKDWDAHRHRLLGRGLRRPPAPAPCAHQRRARPGRHVDHGHAAPLHRQVQGWRGP